ncbi:MAG: hypothetical protein JST54_24425 [Deltaproteobacteria bacterium]|nr:hypothetical protein [Deltaproteobacteria bacterium]
MDAVKRARFAAAGAALLLLAVGFGLGLVVARAIVLRRLSTLSDGPPGTAELKTLMFVAEAELDLDDDQRAKAKLILDKYQPRFVAIRRRNFPEIDALRMERYAELRTLMKPEQTAKFDALVAHYEGQLRKSVGLAADASP